MTKAAVVGKNMNVYTDFVVCGGGKVYGYRETYAEALALAMESKDAKIYGALWEESEFAGLLHRTWMEIKD